MEAPRPTQALLLVGHGSSFGTDAGAPVRAHAERIRGWRVFDEVATAFVKEAPFLDGAVGRLASEDVYIVPVFLAEGYYTRGVVPRELGLKSSDGAIPSWPGDRRVRYTAAVGSHPAMIRTIERRARRALGETGPGDDAALVVIGHGTEKHPGSAGTVLDLTARLRRRSGFAGVTCGFLDQEPRIDAVVATVSARRVVLVPYFLADGMHTRETIPEILRLDGARTVRDGQELWYTPPVGTLPEIARLIVDLARRAGARVPTKRPARDRSPTRGTGATPE
ncbi:MAG TPA: CbiX/SirB N-terminal domain-containing protein [Longimicrobiales bacterium]|nr:CbiX/SirB N-terminal domain-containing protein [Longimicrobiales bacterium]